MIPKVFHNLKWRLLFSVPKMELSDPFVKGYFPPKGGNLTAILAGNLPEGRKGPLEWGSFEKTKTPIKVSLCVEIVLIGASESSKPPSGGPRTQFDCVRGSLYLKKNFR